MLRVVNLTPSIDFSLSAYNLIVLSRSNKADSREEILALARSSSLFRNSFWTLSGVVASVFAFFGGGFWVTFGRVDGGRDETKGTEEKEQVWLENVIAGTT